MGSSIIKRAFTHARQATREGIHLDLARYGVNIWWQGKCGMKWHQVLPTIKFLLTIEEPPHILVIHCGGNDIGANPRLRADIKQVLGKIRSLLPETMIVWSQILPRLHWRGEISHKAVDNIRKRVNSSVATYLLQAGWGAYIKYPEIAESNPDLFVDGVHLSDWGNTFFLHSLQQGLQCFLSSDIRVYPSQT